MINKNILVTVLVNCFNSERYISECLTSLINQSHYNLQIIVWDNQSYDNTSKIVKSFNDPRIHYYISGKFQNLVEARINALRHAQGDYIAILDSDDIAHNNRIQDQLKIFLSDPEIGVVGGSVNYIDSKGQYLKTKSFVSNNSILKQIIYYEFPFNNSTLMFRKLYFDIVKGYNLDFHYINDYDIIYRISKISKITNCKTILSSNRLHYDNLSKRDFIFMQNELFSFLKKIQLKTPNRRLFNLNFWSQFKCLLRLSKYLFNQRLLTQAFYQLSLIFKLLIIFVLYNIKY